MLSIGVCDQQIENIETAVSSAMVAADQAEQRGLNWARYNSAGKDKDAEWRLSILAELDRAIEQGNIWVAYQAKYNLAHGTIVGAEALLRWQHPRRGAISPDEFIPLVEESGRIEKLTMYILDTAIRDFADAEDHLSVAVNISTRLIGHNRLLGPIQSALQHYGMAPHRLTLEITESAAMADDAGIEELKALRELGVHISIDDYGTGQSTLSYLKMLPATEIKIDRSFVQMVLTSKSDAMVVDSTVKLAHALGLSVVAEGVETEEVLALLGKLGCDTAQGYHIARPEKFDDFAQRCDHSSRSAKRVKRMA
jgi:EAL domain-containing protein (putative c-di-GMP-specific phosphodiesterase class I)